MNREDAINATYRQEFYHGKLRNADGSPKRCRVNGKCQTWKTRADFMLPVKHGLKDTFYITAANASDWHTSEESAMLNDLVTMGVSK